MNHQDLIKSLSQETGLPQVKTSEVIERLINTIHHEIKTNGKFTLKNVGSITAISKPERQGRNPATGDTITIQAGTKIKFKTSKALKEFVE